MNISKLTSKEKELLALLNKKSKKPIQWDKMPQQEVYTHLYGWDNPHVDINLLLTPREKSILTQNGFKITNGLKENVELLKRVRRIRKQAPSFIKL